MEQHVSPEIDYPAYREFVLGPGKDKSRWTREAMVGYRYNRMVVMSGRNWHSAGPSFGNSDETARLVQIFSVNEG